MGPETGLSPGTCQGDGCLRYLFSPRYCIRGWIYRRDVPSIIRCVGGGGGQFCKECPNKGATQRASKLEHISIHCWKCSVGNDPCNVGPCVGIFSAVNSGNCSDFRILRRLNRVFYAKCYFPMNNWIMNFSPAEAIIEHEYFRIYVLDKLQNQDFLIQRDCSFKRLDRVARTAFKEAFRLMDLLTSICWAVGCNELTV